MVHRALTDRSPKTRRFDNFKNFFRRFTVSMVNAVVVPPLMSSAMPSRAEAAIDSGVCAASIGQTRFFNQSSNERSSAAPRKSV